MSTQQQCRECKQWIDTAQCPCQCPPPPASVTQAGHYCGYPNCRLPGTLTAHLHGNQWYCRPHWEAVMRETEKSYHARQRILLAEEKTA
jgi:hypothetical protein